MTERRDFIAPQPLPQEEAPEPTWGQTIGAYFRLENDVANAIELLSRPAMPRDPTYTSDSLKEDMKANKLWPHAVDDFIGTGSKAEFLFRSQKRAKEQTDRETIARAGYGGIPVGLAAGILSPTMLIPLVTPARGVKAFVQAGELALVAGALQEAPLQLNQVSRTTGESALNIGAQTVLGTILGGAAQFLKKSQLERMSYDMAHAPSAPAISRRGIQGTAGAVVEMAPARGVHLFPRNLEERSGGLFAKAEGVNAGRAYEVDLKDGLIVSPESLPYISKASKGAITENSSLDDFAAYAKKEGYDSVVVEGFDDFRATVGAEAARLSRSVAELEDGVLLLKKENVKEVDSAPGAMMPRFGGGLDEVTAVNESGEAVSAGAAATRRKTGGIAPSFGAAETIGKISPVVRTIIQETFPQARWMMQQLSDAGLRMYDNLRGKATAVSDEGRMGTIENLIKTWYGGVFKMSRTLDENYGKYVFEGKETPQFAGRLRATMRGKQDRAKLSRQEFNEDVSRVLRGDYESDVPEVNSSAQVIRAELIDPLHKAAQEAGIFKEFDEEIIGDPTYFTRVFNEEAIKKNWSNPQGTGFIDKLSRYYEGKLNEEFQKRLEKYRSAEAKDIQLLTDLALGAEEAAKLRNQFLIERSSLKKSMQKDLQTIDDEILELKKELRDRTVVRTPEEKAAINEEIKKLTEKAGPELEKFKTDRKALSRRIRNLGRNRFIFQDKQLAKLEKIERNEELALDTLERAARSSQKFLTEMETLDQKDFAKQAARLKGQFADVARRWDKNEEAIVGAQGDDVIEKLLGKQELVGSKLDDISKSIDELETFDVEGWRDLVNAGMRESLEKVRDLNGRLALRNEKLARQAKKLDPKVAQEYATKIRNRQTDRRHGFLEAFRVKGIDDPGEALETGVANFKDFSRRMAIETANKITGAGNRLPVLDVIQGLRGIEHARVLGIKSSEIEEFLENDVEHVMRIYTRTLAADTEIAKRFGSANGAREFDKLLEQYNTRKEYIGKLTETTEGKPVTQAMREDMQHDLDKLFHAVKRDLSAVLDRARHIRGIPRDPEDFAYRALRVVTNLNVLRYMGMVTISSIPDVARVIMKHGFTRTMRDGIIPLITNFKELKMSMEELKLAGGALDALIHTRAHELFDVLNDYRPGTKFERGLEAATARMGIIAGFDYWTSAMKQFNAVVLNARMMDAIRLVATGEGSAKEVTKATQWLASLNIADQMPSRIWKEVTDNAGGGKVNGIWLPQTEKWADNDVIAAYRQALVGETDNTIITPGLERPLASDVNPWMKAIFQFKSFALSSVTKTTIAGLQQRDAASMYGASISLALGMFSYYIWAMTASDRSREEMMKADFGHWIDEGISRSGMLGILDEGLRAGERIPLLEGLTRFGKERTSYREGADLLELMMGPSWDFAQKAGGVLMGIDDPTQHTGHMIRQLTPLQNLIGLRTGFDKIEEAIGLPEERGQR